MEEKRQALITIPVPPSGFVNVFLLRGTRPILVDAGNPGTGAAILEKLSENGVDPAEISLILITHGHADHFGSAFELKERTGAPVAVHQLDAEPLRSGRTLPLRPTGTVGRLFLPLLGQERLGKAHPLQPDIIIEGEMSLEEFGVEGKVIHTPGHTAGSISVVLADGDVIVGDLLMGGMIRRNRPSNPMFADDIEQLKESVKSVMRLSPRRVFTSHGGPLDPQAILRRFPWLN
jgi:hydroxyacylglutathione hydrolase